MVGGDKAYQASLANSQVLELCLSQLLLAEVMMGSQGAASSVPPSPWERQVRLWVLRTPWHEISPLSPPPRHREAGS